MGFEALPSISAQTSLVMLQPRKLSFIQPSFWFQYAGGYLRKNQALLENKLTELAAQREGQEWRN